MEKQKNEDDVKTDLKHDTMEFAEPVEGENRLDIDKRDATDDDIAAEELNALNDGEENEAAALVATEIDLQADEDQMPEEDWTDDLPDTDQEEDKDHHRS